MTSHGSKRFIVKWFGVCQVLWAVSSLQLQKPKERNSKCFLKERAENTLCLKVERCLVKVAAQDIVGEELETKINLCKVATKWTFYFLPEA